MKIKRTFNEIKQLIETKNGKLLNDFVKNKTRYITIKCNVDGNIWTCELSAVVSAGQWCKVCYNRNRIKPVNIKDLKSLLSDKGFVLITKEPITYWSKIKLHCPGHNHTWKTTYGHLKSGYSNCKFCGHNTIKFNEINDILKEHNATFVRRIKNANGAMNVVLRCNVHNHEWRTNLRDVKKLERWCTHCARERRKTSYEAIKEAVENKKGKLLSADCCGSLTKFNVECSNGHVWETCFDYINQGYWCPECPYKSQTLLHDIVKELFPDYKTYYNYRKFNWLKSNKNLKQNMEIDIWVPELKLAIEYDGIQHFQPVKFSYDMTDAQSKKAFSDIKRRDKKKDKLIKQNENIVKYFIRFSYKEEITKESVTKKLMDIGVVRKDRDELL